ncbi:hypothetical protein BDZ89DRAFT_380269 [Hymenopellis radicata]|nr:hypothetical protein BDZ89DRAFT_380269 [Hymenopellis radicata]
MTQLHAHTPSHPQFHAEQDNNKQDLESSMPLRTTANKSSKIATQGEDNSSKDTKHGPATIPSQHDKQRRHWERQQR